LVLIGLGFQKIIIFTRQPHAGAELLWRRAVYMCAGERLICEKGADADIVFLA
jgi:hypothetical protein